MALHFVTQVDEFLFEALVPRRMANMVNSMAIQALQLGGCCSLMFLARHIPNMRYLVWFIIPIF